MEERPGIDSRSASCRATGRPGQQILLQRDGDQLLDLRRGEAEGLGLHLHGGAGVNSGRESTCADFSCHTPAAISNPVKTDDDAPKPQAGPDEPPHATLRDVGCHGRGVERRPSSSATTETRVVSGDETFDA